MSVKPRYPKEEFARLGKKRFEGCLTPFRMPWLSDQR